MSAIGKIVYQLYYKPRTLFRRLKNNGGLNYLRIQNAKRQMKVASNALAMLKTPIATEEVYFLTGKDFWPLTAFCMYSLALASDNGIRPVFIDDGSLTEKLIKKMKSQFPGCVVKTSAEIQIVIDQHLPVNKFPLIHQKRMTYPHFKKITDVHAGSSGWKLVLDSDMLFFKYPQAMINWLKKPEYPFFLSDPVSSYHYSFSLMEELTQEKVIPNLNVGVVGLKSETIDWEKLEFWIGNLEKREGSSYLLEQALSAMLAAGQTVVIADKFDYIVMPGQNDVIQKQGILHHYVDSSKEWYFKKAWQSIL